MDNHVNINMPISTRSAFKGCVSYMALFNGLMFHQSERELKVRKNIYKLEGLQNEAKSQSTDTL